MASVLDSTSGWVRGIPERYGRRTVIFLALILLVGFGLRADRVVNPVTDPVDDAAAYLDLSRSLYEDGTYGSPGFQNTSDWSPGAPLLYAASFYATGGVREGTVRILNTILGCLGIVVVFLLGLGWARGRPDCSPPQPSPSTPRSSTAPARYSANRRRCSRCPPRCSPSSGPTGAAVQPHGCSPASCSG